MQIYVMTGNPVTGEKVALPARHLSFPAGNPLRKGPTLSDNSVPNESTYELVPKLRRDLCTMVTTLTGCSNFVAAAVDIVYYVEHKLHVLVNSIQACVMTPPSTVAPQAWVFFLLRCVQGPCSARSRTYAAGCGSTQASSLFTYDSNQWTTSSSWTTASRRKEHKLDFVIWPSGCLCLGKTAGRS